MKRLLSFTAIFIFLSFLFQIDAQVLAFPGAEGFGKYALGARAGGVRQVYRVTNLNDAGPGSLRDAISQPNRIVIFDVAGVIKIKSRLVFSSNLYVAGQTAPGDGITVYGNGVSFSGANNIIVRYMRFRMGIGGDSGKDAAGIANGKNMIFDHVSVTWGRDENFSISWDKKGNEPGDITIQNSIIGQGLQTHSAGGLVQTNGGVTLYRNLYIDNKTRNPKVKGLNQYVNNVVYNWGSGGGYILGDSEGTSWGAIEDNYFIKGPSTGGTDAFVRGNLNFQVFHKGNYLDYSRDGVLNGIPAEDADLAPVTFISDKSQFVGIPKLHPEITTNLTALEAYDWVVENVGASLPKRDQVDAYLIDELTSLGTTGTLINGEVDLGLPGIVGNVFNGPGHLDTDNDGIPDFWEDANGLDKNNSADALLVHSDGYLNIERYINSITDGIPFLRYPTQLGVKAIDSDFIFLKWVNNQTDIKNIVIESSTDNVNYEVIATLPPTAVEFKNENLQPTTTYYYRIKVVSETMESLYSDVFNATTFGVPSPPVAASSPVPADGSTIGEYVETTLSWTNTTGFWGGDLYYTLYFGTEADNLTLMVEETMASSHKVQLQPETTYYWRVDTKNALGAQTGDLWSFTSAKQTEKEKIAYFKFDETSGNSAKNEIFGSAEAADLTPSWTSGVVNNSIVFAGTPATQRMVQPHYDLMNLSTQSFSFDIWFKSSGGSGVDWYLLHKGSHAKNTAAGTTGRWIGLQYKNNILVFGIDDDVIKSTVDISGSNVYFNNEWTHVACVRDTEAKKIRMYINGELKGESNDNTGDISQIEDLVIGNCNINFNTPFKGSLDELSFYSSALTADDVKNIYDSALQTSVFRNQIAEKLTVYPTLFSNELIIELPHNFTGKEMRLNLYTTTGQQMYNSVIKTETNEIQVSDLSSLPSGTYICTVKTNAGILSSLVVKK
ncbi:MAG: T9SS type A sorting domain-containing protein [Porphyromonadaceae bacterium]|nr:T9SS type A sorting domain-containing protein [Porphyromonadaceae bacterium]